LIPRAAFFISDFPFVAFVSNRMSSQQQDLPDITLFRGGSSFGRLAEWQLAAYWITSFSFRPASTMGKCSGRT
jgi:hypothetical protein